MNVLHIRTIGSFEGGVDDDLDEAITAMETCYDSMSNVMARNAVVTIGHQIIAEPYTAPQFYPFTPVTSNASDEGAQAPPHLAIVVNLRTTSATRRGRGRVFIGPLNSLAIGSDDGTIATDRLAMVRNAWQSFVADSLTANGWGLAVWSDLDSLARDVTSAAVNDRFGVLRSRRP